MLVDLSTIFLWLPRLFGLEIKVTSRVGPEAHALTHQGLRSRRFSRGIVAFKLPMVTKANVKSSVGYIHISELFIVSEYDINYFLIEFQMEF